MAARYAAKRGHLMLSPRLYLVRQNTPDYKRTEMCNPLSPWERCGEGTTKRRDRKKKELT